MKHLLNLSTFILFSLFLIADFSCIPGLLENGFEEYTLSVRPNIIILNKDITYLGISRLPIEVTIVKRDQDGNFGYEYSVDGETNSSGVYLSSKTWDFTIESSLDEIWITVYEEDGSLIGNCYKKYSGYRDQSYYQPDCLLYY